MPDDPDFGFYGKGLNGYVHYNQDFDENFPNRGGGGGNRGGGGGSPTWLRVIVALAIVFFIFWLIDELGK